jgi:carbon-monoxide dehydrogenase small subunit
MILSGAQLLERQKNPTRADICRSIEGNLCRCTGYSHIIDAISKASRS